MTYRVTKTFLNSLSSLMDPTSDSVIVRDFNLIYPDDSSVRTKFNYRSTDKLLVSDVFQDLVQFSVHQPFYLPNH